MKTLYYYAIATLMFLGGVQTLYGQCAIFYTDTVLVPDDQSTCLESSIFVAETSIATINSLEQVPDVQINFEHSFMGDLVITLICPNGQSIVLHQSGGGGTYLGEPVDNDATPLEMGVGYDYSWSSDAVLGTWSEESPLYTTLPSGTYASTQPWSMLVGCPVSGEWTLEICDLWISDNGFLFSRGLIWPEEAGFSSEDCENFGCIDSSACNYTGAVFGNTSLCIYFGCTDEGACNYDPSAGCDDGGCIYPGCSISAACNYDPNAGCGTMALCTFPGCTDEGACNYEPSAGCDDGGCILPGCAIAGACNFSQVAYFFGCADNSLCIFPECNDPEACNYVEDPECENASVCVYSTCVTINHQQIIDTSCASGTINLQTYELGPGSYHFEWVVKDLEGTELSSIWLEPFTSYEVTANEPGVFFTEVYIYTGIFYSYCCTFPTGSGFVEIPEYSGPTPNIAFDPEQNELSCSNCIGELNYQWYFNSVQVFGATNQTFTPSMSGLVYVCVYAEDNPNCSACSDEGYFFVTSTHDITQSDARTVFTVQHGFVGGMTITSQSSTVLVLDMYTSTGAFVSTYTIFPGEKHVLENLASGVYLVHDSASGVVHKCVVL